LGTTADKLSKIGWSLGYVSAIDSNGRTIWIADAHRDDGNRLVARSDAKLTAFLELERVTRESKHKDRASENDLPRSPMILSPRPFCFLKTRTLLWIGRQQRF
jgi:hypothetical protein